MTPLSFRIRLMLSLYLTWHLITFLFFLFGYA